MSLYGIYLVPYCILGLITSPEFRSSRLHDSFWILPPKDSQVLVMMGDRISRTGAAIAVSELCIQLATNTKVAEYKNISFIHI